MPKKLTLAQGQRMKAVMPSSRLNPAAKPGLDRKTMLSVIRTYQAGRRAGIPQWEIDLQVMSAFKERHPEVPRSEAGQIVPHIIAWVAREHGEWFWRSCERPYVDPRRDPDFDPVKGYHVPGPKPEGAVQ